MKKRDNRIQRILLIDDCEEDRARIRSALMRGAPRRRYQFREANNGAEGLEICQDCEDWPIDCVIMDMNMPQLSGPEFLQLLREPYDFPILPVVVLTGSTMHEDAGDTLQLGAQDYVTKDSIYPSVLFRVVDNAIERHQLLKELHQSRIAADAANRAKSAMVGNISHEIRTPMTAVMGLCEVLLDTDISEDQENLLHMIRDNGEYLVEIVNDLLDISKLEAGGLEIEHEPFHLREMLQRTITLMDVRAKENQTTLKLDIADDVPSAILSDPIRIRQIALNLVSNAIKFSPQKEVTVQVTCQTVDEAVTQPSGESTNERLRVDVIDTGIGIVKDDLERIFEPFVQSESNGRAKPVGGTGLGLAICRRLVDLLGGELTVESTFGSGSTFTFQVPLYRSAAEQAEAERKPRMLSAKIEDLLADCPILVAEDARATRVLLRRVLEKVGSVVTIVSDGQQLIDRYLESPNEFQVIITDIQMPVVDGLDATRQLRDHGCELPIVVLTADVISETREHAVQAGATDILTKPINRTALLETVAGYCDEDCDE